MIITFPFVADNKVQDCAYNSKQAGKGAYGKLWQCLFFTCFSRLEYIHSAVQSCLHHEPEDADKWSKIKVGTQDLWTPRMLTYFDCLVEVSPWADNARVAEVLSLLSYPLLIL